MSVHTVTRETGTKDEVVVPYVSDTWQVVWEHLKTNASDLASVAARRDTWQIEAAGRCTIFPFLVYGPLLDNDATHTSAKDAVTSFVNQVDVPSTTNDALNSTIDALHGDFHALQSSPFVVLLVHLFVRLMVIFGTHPTYGHNLTFVSSRYNALMNACRSDFVAHAANRACIDETIEEFVPNDILTGRLYWHGLKVMGEAIESGDVQWDRIKMAEVCATLELMRRQIARSIASHKPPFEFCALGEHWMALLGHWASISATMSMPPALTTFPSSAEGAIPSFGDDISKTFAYLNPASNAMVELSSAGSLPYNASLYFPPNFIVEKASSSFDSSSDACCFHVHDYALAAAWPYFANMLKVGMSECAERRLVLPASFPSLLLRIIIHYAYSSQHTVIYHVVDANQSAMADTQPPPPRANQRRFCEALDSKGLPKCLNRPTFGYVHSDIARFCYRHRPAGSVLLSKSPSPDANAAKSHTTMACRRVFAPLSFKDCAVALPVGILYNEWTRHPSITGCCAAKSNDVAEVIEFVSQEIHVQQYALQNIVTQHTCAGNDLFREHGIVNLSPKTKNPDD